MTIAAALPRAQPGLTRGSLRPATAPEAVAEAIEAIALRAEADLELDAQEHPTRQADRARQVRGLVAHGVELCWDRTTATQDGGWGAVRGSDRHADSLTHRPSSIVADHSRSGH